MTILLFSGAMGGGLPTIFDLPLTDSGAGAVSTTPASSTGSGTATFTRATTAFTTLSTGLLAQVSSGVARSNYSPAGTYLGYLAEGQRTNLCLQSQTLGSALSWSLSRASISVDAAVAPDGTTTADKLVEDASTNTHLINQSITITAAAYTWSIYAKSAGRSWLVLNAYDGADHFTYFDLTNGVVGTNAVGNTAVISAAANGFYRVSVSRTSGSTGGYIELYTATADNTKSYAGDGVSGIYLWGSQLELGAFPSTYIPTVAASVTRNADVLTYVTTGNISDTAGGAYAEITETSYANAAGTIIGNGTNGPLVPSSANSGFVFKDGTSTVNGPTGSPSGTIKGASSWSGSASQVAVGGTAGTAGSYDGAFGLATIGIGTSGYGSIKNVKIYGSALTAAQLQALTA